jgi:hemoglobin
MQLRKVLLAVSLSVVVACGGSKKNDTMTNTGSGDGSAMAVTGEKSLYDRLGGKDAISAVVDEFLTNVKADKEINAMFANADGDRLKKMLVDQICEATGGPCKYTGKTMKEAHTGMNIKDSDFNALVGDLVKALDKFQVPKKEKDELLGALAKMHDDIVTKK